MELEWKEPPTTAVREAHKKYNAIVEALKQRPGQWARVSTGEWRNSAQRVLIRREGIEATTRKQADGMLDTYARYVGGESDE